MLITTTTHHQYLYFVAIMERKNYDKYYQNQQSITNWLYLYGNLDASDTYQNWYEVDHWSNNNDASAFYGQYPFLKEVFCINAIVTASPTVAISAPVQQQYQNQPATYLITIRNKNIFLHTINTETTIRNKITLVIQDYFASAGTVAFTYIINIINIDYDYQSGDSEIEFTVNKPSSSGWSDIEINDYFYDSDEDAQLYYLLAKHLELEWDYNGIINEDDILSIYQSGVSGEIEVKRDYMQVRLTDFPMQFTPTTTQLPLPQQYVI